MTVVVAAIIAPFPFASDNHPVSFTHPRWTFMRNNDRDVAGVGSFQPGKIERKRLFDHESTDNRIDTRLPPRLNNFANRRVSGGVRAGHKATRSDDMHIARARARQ